MSEPTPPVAKPLPEAAPAPAATPPSDGAAPAAAAAGRKIQLIRTLI